MEEYLASIKGTDYPFRAFLNRKYFTDGLGNVDAIAWMPPPSPYNPEETE